MFKLEKKYYCYYSFPPKLSYRAKYLNIFLVTDINFKLESITNLMILTFLLSVFHFSAVAMPSSNRTVFSYLNWHVMLYFILLVQYNRSKIMDPIELRRTATDISFIVPIKIVWLYVCVSTHYSHVVIVVELSMPKW